MCLRMFDARKELLRLKTSGLENIILSPLTTLSAPTVSQAQLPAAYHIDTNPCFKTNDSEVFTNCSGSSVGYHSSEEADQFSAQKNNSLISPIQRPSPRSSPGSSTSGHFSDSMLGSDVNNRKMSSSPSNSIEGINKLFLLNSCSPFKKRADMLSMCFGHSKNDNWRFRKDHFRTQKALNCMFE